MAETIIAEKAVIGIMLAYPDKQDEAFRTLSYNMFASEICRDLFLFCRNLAEKGQQADTVNTLATLQDEYRVFALQCVETFPSVSGYQSYINCVLDGWRKRQLVGMMQRLLMEDADADAISAAITQAAEKQQYILAHQREETARTFADGAQDFLTWLQKPSDNIPTGFSGLDMRTGGLARGGVTVIAARPGKGKSTLALQMATQISQNHLTVYHSMEMSREQLYVSVMARWLPMDSRKLMNHKLTDLEREQVETGTKLLGTRFKLILDDSSLTGLDDVEATIKTKKPEVVFVDHLGLLVPKNAREKRNDELAALTRGLKQIAMRYNVCIVELVQAARASENKRISMADMFGSATIEHDADMIIAVNPEDSQRNDVRATVEVIKNRHGAGGAFDFMWYKPHHKFTEVAY